MPPLSEVAILTRCREESNIAQNAEIGGGRALRRAGREVTCADGRAGDRRYTENPSIVADSPEIFDALAAAFLCRSKTGTGVRMSASSHPPWMPARSIEPSPVRGD